MLNAKANPLKSLANPMRTFFASSEFIRVVSDGFNRPDILSNAPIICLQFVKKKHII